MTLKKWIESIYAPKETNLRDDSIEDMLLALNEPAVRKHWVEAMVEELRAINVGLDRNLDESSYYEIPMKAARRRTLLFCLQQILDSKRQLDNDRFESQRDNQALANPYEGVAVQRDVQ